MNNILTLVQKHLIFHVGETGFEPASRFRGGFTVHWANQLPNSPLGCLEGNDPSTS